VLCKISVLGSLHLRILTDGIYYVITHSIYKIVYVTSLDDYYSQIFILHKLGVC
jgi:hypothetical protein